jgi:hypothetical protein
MIFERLEPRGFLAVIISSDGEVEGFAHLKKVTVPARLYRFPLFEKSGNGRFSFGL